MEESINHRAYIKDFDADTFASFVRYAYMGLCGMWDGMVCPESDESRAVTQYQCCKCRTISENNDAGHYPFCYQIDCRASRELFQTGITGVRCVVPRCNNWSSWNKDVILLCSVHIVSDIGRYYPAHREYNSLCRKLKRSEKFRSRSYSCQGITQKQLRDHLDYHQSKHKTTEKTIKEPLLRHVKLYALAHKYMIKDLQDICLYKLHRNLCSFRISDSTIDEMIDLVSYTYCNTSDEGDITKGDIDPMRDLVMAFVKDQTKKLMAYEGFRFMLASGGPQTADFFAIAFL